jgi:hypothetical protein
MRFLLLMGMLFATPALACDFCGCSPSTATWDQNVNSPASYIQISPFVKGVNFNDPSSSLNSSFLTGSLLKGSYAPATFVELSVQLPFMYINNQFSETSQSNVGIGDLLILSNFRVLQKAPSGEKKTGHTLMLNGGIELPTGSYAVSEDPLLSNVSFGSKSVDYVMGGAYKLSIFRGAFITGSSVKLNTLNKEDLKFGHQLSVYTQGTFSFMKKEIMWQPALGSRYDFYARNIYRGINQNKTGGDLLQITAGISAGKGKWGWGMQIMQPLWQQNGGGVFKHLTSAYFSLQYQFKK